MYSKLLNLIEEYNDICIFRHVRPDGDATFSSLAMYYFLKDNFKNKNIKIGGNEKFDLVSKNDKISDKLIQKSLVIILDTATSERIDDFRALAGKYIVKIDHHPITEQYGELNIVNPNASSASEVLAKILLSSKFNKYKISQKVYEYLFCGILTDTLCFKTANTTSNTLKIASKLVEYGNLKISDLYEYINDVNIDTYNKISKLRTYLKVENSFGLIKLDKKALVKLDMDALEAKNQIDEIGGIKELKVWAIATENEDGWDCSLRSKRPYVINKFTYKYGGGGHPNACAVKHVSLSQINSLIKEISEFSK